jgi:hypothetical protein
MRGELAIGTYPGVEAAGNFLMPIGELKCRLSDVSFYHRRLTNVSNIQVVTGSRSLRPLT